MKTHISLLFCLLFTLGLQAQQSFCGAHRSQAQIDWLKQHQQSNMRYLPPATTKCLPIQAHIVGRDDGTGYYRLENLWSQICDLNAAYSSTGMQFYLDLPLSYLDNTIFYEHTTYGQINQGVTQTYVYGKINTYFSGEAAGNCGYFTGGLDCMVISNGCANIGDKTYPHELGHFFSLDHTFYGWEGGTTPPQNQQEKVNGTNCNWAGDGFCDTPPDYAYYRWSCPLSTVYVDPNGDTLDIDETLYMSYAYDNCVNRFSNQQETAMYQNWTQQRNNIQYKSNVSTDSLGVVDQVYPLDGQSIPYNHVTLKWSAVPGAEAYHVTLTSFPTFANTTHDFVVEGDTSITIISDTNYLPKFIEDKMYKWKVKAISSGYYCDAYSEIKEFYAGAYNELSGISELDGQSIKVYPNVISRGEAVQVDLSAPWQGNASLFNAMGQRVWASPFKASFELNTQSLPVGMYVLKLEGQQRQAQQRIIVR